MDDRIKEALKDRGYEDVEDVTWICPECGEFRPDDDRVANGMHCYYCNYGGE